jgi:putative flippase GtrA
MHTDPPWADKPVVVVPAYCPAPTLPGMVETLLNSGLIRSVIVVNDGSGREYEALFDELAPMATVIRHVTNLGKGAALKTGINTAACDFPNSVGIVTADADGQHAVEDVLKVADALDGNPQSLVLGTRAFDKDVPLRSRFGNAVTRHALRLITGQKIADTQTGLRGIPMGMAPMLLRIPSNGYEFELDMLLTCKTTHRSIIQTGIETIYINQNRASHFDPIFDSMRIYFVLLRFALSSIAAAIIDNLVFTVVFVISTNIAVSQIFGRTSGALFNYLANRKLVFQSKETVARTLPKYIALVMVSGTISFGLLLLIQSMISSSIIVAKVLAELLLFFFNFMVQRDYVFFRRSQETHIDLRRRPGLGARA